MKVKGFSEEICSVCELFDSSIGVLYKDLSLYLSSGVTEPKSNQIDDDESKDREKAIQFLRDCSHEHVTGLVQIYTYRQSTFN